ncbi:4757_t:CDS:2 [Entrophospora sp. SA101]|nr:7012_t:CDS:2 [Entrophospora candida]CAH1765635.1 9920_t:CDS:2 [Entrophospora sp. SA101]CAJ0643045.1 5513_t:CDS:2 [Entrophospora sp. SA101]CAJ0749507.1 10854_t:CDS:2 [Entrophospora sp. SA101]CAJ0750832.1 4757_t:CDS:2 [Entrophospora sp. SA101]
MSGSIFYRRCRFIFYLKEELTQKNIGNHLIFECGTKFNNRLSSRITRNFVSKKKGNEGIPKSQAKPVTAKTHEELSEQAAKKFSKKYKERTGETIDPEYEASIGDRKAEQS